MNTQKIDPNTPEVQPAAPCPDDKFRRENENDERLTRFYRACDERVDTREAYDEVESHLGTNDERRARLVLYHAACMLEPVHSKVSEQSHAYHSKELVKEALRLAHTVLEVGNILEDARGTARCAVAESRELVDPEELRTMRLKAEAFDADVARQDAKRDEAFKAGAESMRLQFVEAAEKAAESQRGPKLRKLRLVKPAPKSRRAPVSSKAVRRAS